MADNRLRWYILVDNYEQGMALHDLLTADGVPNRIAPAPRGIGEKVSCGMALLVEPDWIEAARASIAAHGAPFHGIVSLAGQLKSHRDVYC